MSYILEALKKADRERATGNVPDLETVHLQSSAARTPYRLLWILTIIFIFNGILITLLVIRNDVGSGEDAVERLAAPDDHNSALPRIVRTRPSTETTPLVRKTPPRVERIAPQMQEHPRTTVAGPATPPVQPATMQDQTPVQPVDIVPPSPPPVMRPSPAPSVATATAPEPGKIPQWDELPLEFRSGFSMPRIDVHVYDSAPQRRFILVNLQKFREGDRLPNGAIIEKILPDGIQLSYQGTRFHYPK